MPLLAATCCRPRCSALLRGKSVFEGNSIEFVILIGDFMISVGLKADVLHGKNRLDGNSV